jgi:hypothetical protein
MKMVTQNLEAPREEAPAPYVAPQLKLVGNLNDLLAGTGTQNTDNAQTCPANTSSFFSMDCV